MALQGILGLSSLKNAEVIVGGAKSASYAISAERCRCYSHCRRSVADGDSPNRDWYSTAKRPSCQKP